MVQSKILPDILKGRFSQYVKNFSITHLSTDSRNTVFSESSLFFAIKGKIHDGHHYIDDLYQNNVRQFIVERIDIDLGRYPMANFFFCDNSIQALQTIVAHHRQSFNLKVLGITGSNGKTIIKEWISMILSWKYNVIKSPKSFNSQIGVPLSVWQINESHNFGVFEAGISRTGEMKNLEEVIKPEIGLLTNLGSAHDEGFSSRTEKLLEKLQLFRNANVLIYNIDDHIIHANVLETLPHIKKVSWGHSDRADYHIDYVADANGKSRIGISSGSSKYEYQSTFSDPASLENLIHCIVFFHYLGWKQHEIQDGLNALHPISMRLEMKKGINDTYLIDDTYNNDLVGLKLALNYLNNQNQRPQKSIILSDILQSGIHVDQLYKDTADIINQSKFNRIIGIGQEIRHMKKYLSAPFYWFKDTSDFLHLFELDSFNNEIILVKGARDFGLEKVISYLQEKVHGTVLEINLDALSHNLNVYRSCLKPATKIMVMVKALAYGSGSIEVANLLEFHRVDYLGVAYTDEGVTLRKNGINLPIMIMNPSFDSIDKIIEFRLEPEIYNVRLLREIDRYTQKFDHQIRVHLKLDTGMNRLGFESGHIEDLINILNNNRRIEVASIFSHLSSAEDVNQDKFTREQAILFNTMADKIQQLTGISCLRHLANSAAIVRYPEYHYDMVRLGIGLYGYDATGEIKDRLKSIGSLTTEISQIKKLHKGDSVGYGRKGKIDKDTTIATIAIGYADGFFRAFGNKTASVWVNGTMAPVVGNVCMDMTMIDITGIQAKEGDPVIIFGKEQSLKSLADKINTIPYEILTNISERVKRIYISE